MDVQRALDVSQELRLNAPSAGRYAALMNRAARLLEDALPTPDQKAIRGRFGGRRKPVPVARRAVSEAPALVQAGFF